MKMLNSVKKFAATALFLLLSSSPALAQQPENLFTNRPEPVNPSGHGISAHAALVDTGPIARGVKNLRLLLPDGTEAELEQDGFEKRGPGNAAWRGRAVGDENSRVTITLYKGWVSGRIQIGVNEYEIKPQRGRKVIVEELDPASYAGCGNDASHVVETAGEVPGGATAAAGDPAPAGDAAVVMDLLSLYTPQARAGAGSASQIEALIQAGVDASNTAFIDSNMNVRFRLVHTAEANHNDAGDLSPDLDWVTSDPGVASLRDQYGADLVSLITEDGGGWCGLGWVQRNPGPGFEDLAFQVTARSCVVGNLSFPHEHGHNMGMEHNPENSGATQSTASYPHSFAQYIDGSYRTVMSYSDPCTNNNCTRVTHFSNPDVSFNGYATGIAGEKDNALTGDLTGPIVANFRAAVVPPAGSTRFAVIGDYGSDDSDLDERDVADLVASWSPDFVITAGDNRYGGISMDSAIGKYYCDFLADAGSGSYCSGNNASINAFFPSLGNHDYSDGGGISEYLGYFELPGAGISTTGTSNSEKYYDFVQGPVHFFVVNTEESSTFNTQKSWLQQQLAASTTPWQVVYFHSAPYSSGSHGSDTSMQWPFASWGADAVIAGHDHTYERLEINGIPYFVNGLGGMSRYSFGTPIAGSIVRYRDNYGAMLVDATDTDVTFHFINVAGTVIDSHSITQGSSNGVLNIRVAQSSDDAEELVDSSPALSYSTGNMTLTSTDLEMVDDSGWHGGDQEVGIRFQNVNIPQGATILAAYLEFATDEAGSDPTTVNIRAQDSDNAATFTTAAYNISSRPTTSVSASWTIPGWSTIGKLRTTPDLTAVVQEVVDRAGWAANNSMAFLITGSGVRTAEAYDGEPALAPLLHVEFDTQQPSQTFTNSTSVAISPSGTPMITSDIVVNGMTGSITDVDVGLDITHTWDSDLDVTLVAPDGTRILLFAGIGGSDDNFTGTVLDDEAATIITTGMAPFTGRFRPENLLSVLDGMNPNGTWQLEISDTANNDGGSLNEWSLAISGIQPSTNVPPTAGFTYSVTDLTVDFTDNSTDSDGNIVSWSWDFGDGNSSTTQNPGHTYAAAGNYTVTLTVADDDGATDSTSHSVNISVASALGIHEAEDAFLSGPVVANNLAGYSGSGFADYINASGDYVEWTVDAANAGQYSLRFRYALSSGDRPLQISVNGQVIEAAMSFPATGSFSIWGMTADVAATLNIGINTIRATAIGSSGANVDYLEISYSTPNVAPTAGFTYSCTDLDCGFDDTSSDSDGSIVSWSWDFGGIGTSSAQNPDHSFSTAGTYLVSLTVTDDDGATDTDTASITVEEAPDTTPPSITAPADVEVEATGQTTPVSMGTPTVNDDTDPNPTVINNAPAAFPVGTTTVTWTATDAAGNSTNATQEVTVTDTTAPSITAPADVSVESAVPVAVALGTPSVSDLAGPAPAVSNDAPALFPVGITTVTWTATDASGNSATATQEVTVTVPDTTPPSITVPADVTVEATGVTTSVSLGTPTVSDDTDSSPSVSSDAPATFPVGVTIVTWTATDASGNSASDTQTVTISDTTAPSITAPADVSVESAVPLAVALGTPSVSDLADPAPLVSKDAPELFPIGTTVVIWTATDASGNSATDTQTVTVTEPPPVLEIHVGDLTSSASGKKNWKAVVTITVHDAGEGAMSGVTVNGTWSGGSNGSCVTDGSGQCTVSKRTKANSLTFTVDNLSGGGAAYQSDDNHVSSITVDKP